ncbi:hypothetical protein AWB69_08225 [Caballeronia udeis]|uniref:Uncharacterized protein n=1 Tax=Caballeronia udeis TaxID=1232866 RepID=A0A158JL33_9BURK|nr:hypothetical protein [Caballeronia udeis]SAL69574.1 hypothetical protein AWB69_08225 [Caballeronia udeis]
MADISAALIGFLGVMAGGYFNNFFAEDYRRFRDGQALAGALAGELESHTAPIPRIREGLAIMEEQIRSGKKLDLPEWPMPPSPIFDQNAAKIGSLGAETAKEVAYVYEHLRAYRQNFHMLSKHNGAMPVEWSHATIIGCLAIISRSENRAVQLAITLTGQTEESYWRRPQTQAQLKYGAAVIAAFLLALKVFG